MHKMDFHVQFRLAFVSGSIYSFRGLIERERDRTSVTSGGVDCYHCHRPFDLCVNGPFIGERKKIKYETRRKTKIIYVSDDMFGVSIQKPEFMWLCLTAVCIACFNRVNRWFDGLIFLSRTPRSPRNVRAQPLLVYTKNSHCLLFSSSFFFVLCYFVHCMCIYPLHVLLPLFNTMIVIIISFT